MKVLKFLGEPFFPADPRDKSHLAIGLRGVGFLIWPIIPMLLLILQWKVERPVATFLVFLMAMSTFTVGIFWASCAIQGWHKKKLSQTLKQIDSVIKRIETMGDLMARKYLAETGLLNPMATNIDFHPHHLGNGLSRKVENPYMFSDWAFGRFCDMAICNRWLGENTENELAHIILKRVWPEPNIWGPASLSERHKRAKEFIEKNIGRKHNRAIVGLVEALDRIFLNERADQIEKEETALAKETRRFLS